MFVQPPWAVTFAIVRRDEAVAVTLEPSAQVRVPVTDDHGQPLADRR